tara:strand:+ start:9020 stop:9709 length:690 start_codon:yes stop_codon:yes gene_type:complete
VNIQLISGIDRQPLKEKPLVIAGNPFGLALPAHLDYGVRNLRTEEPLEHVSEITPCPVILAPKLDVFSDENSAPDKRLRVIAETRVGHDLQSVDCIPVTQPTFYLVDKQLNDFQDWTHGAGTMGEGSWGCNACLADFSTQFHPDFILSSCAGDKIVIMIRSIVYFLLGVGLVLTLAASVWAAHFLKARIGSQASPAALKLNPDELQKFTSSIDHSHVTLRREGAENQYP